MTKSILLAFIIFLSIQGFAQKTNLIFFTEQGERFYLVLNGIQQNQEAQTNVLVTDLPAPSYKVKVIFEDTQLGEIDKNLMFQQNTESTFNIKRNNKNEWVIRFLNQVLLAQAPAPSPEQYVIVYHTTPPPPPQTVTTVSQTTTMTGAVVTVADPIGVVNADMNTNGTVTTSGTTTTMTTTTTTVSSTAAYAPVEFQEHPSYVMPGYSGMTGCDWPMSDEEFNRVKNSISSKSFDDSRLIIAKQVIAANCLLCSQVREIMLLLTFEDARLDLAKHAYGYTYDLGNYYQLNDAFTFESTIEELNEYINNYHR